MSSNWVQLINGGKFSLDPAVPHELGILTVFDVAKALSQINRYRGATFAPVNVAQHSVLVSEVAYDMAPTNFKALAGLVGLAHDAHEMVISDIPSPLKRRLASRCVDFAEEMRALQDRADRVFYRVLGIDFFEALRLDVFGYVHLADVVALATEYRDCCAHVHEWPKMPAPVADKFVPLSPGSSARLFYDRWEKLHREFNKIGAAHADENRV